MDRVKDKPFDNPFLPSHSGSGAKQIASSTEKRIGFTMSAPNFKPAMIITAEAPPSIYCIDFPIGNILINVY
jgi:hypothetical protein